MTFFQPYSSRCFSELDPRAESCRGAISSRSVRIHLWNSLIHADYLVTVMAGERSVATPQVDAHLSVEPGYGLSLSQTPEATGWLGGDLLLLKPVSLRLEHERMYFNVNLQLWKTTSSKRYSYSNTS